MSVISATNLHKKYGNNHALNGFNMQVQAKRIVGLIGPNGAGKTTALRAIMGLGSVQGELRVLGMNPFSQRHQLMTKASYIADVGTLPRWMKVAKLLDFVNGVHPAFDLQQAKSILAKTNIQLTSKIGTLSKGMVTQLHLALVSSIDAELLVLDEPTLGLDIIYRQEFYDRLLGDFHEQNRTVIISTHEVREIEHILTDVVFIAEGRSVLSLNMEELPKRFSHVSVKDTHLEEALTLHPISQHKSWNAQELIFENTEREVLQKLGEVRTPNLAELFIACMGERR